MDHRGSQPALSSSQNSVEMKRDVEEEGRKEVAPDGGWGWFVCLGSSLITLSLRSLDPSFGLLFQDLLKDLDVDSTGTSLIMSVLDAIVNFSGVFVGPLLKKYSYRKVALFGSFLSCTGLILTSRANSMLHIICTYSILGGLGTGLAVASSFVALNTFFDKKRGQAVGLSMAGTTLAMMLVPQGIHILLESYGFRGTMLIVGAWALHSVVGASLLRPLERGKRRKKKGTVKETIAEAKEVEVLLEKHGDESHEKRSTINEEIAVTDGKEILVEPQEVSGKKEEKENGKSDGNGGNSFRRIVVRYLGKIRSTFDLDLLKDGIYLNVITGLSLYYVAESNFKLMTPFFLSGIGMTNAEVASCLSLTAFTDILARLLLPTIFDRLRLKKRKVFWTSCLFVGIGRSVLAEQTKGTALLVTLIVIGFLRGATLVNLNLSVSECCSLKKLPSAFGMFMVSKGMFVVAISPLIGYIRDVSDSYSFCIHVMTGMIIASFFAWAIEFSVKAWKRRKCDLRKQVQRDTVE